VGQQGSVKRRTSGIHVVHILTLLLSSWHASWKSAFHFSCALQVPHALLLLIGSEHRGGDDRDVKQGQTIQRSACKGKEESAYKVKGATQRRRAALAHGILDGRLLGGVSKKK
jgi:hypothetical protein